jgi:hypothetical protein
LPSSVEYAYFEFENTPVRLVAVHKIPRVETPGLLIKETEASREFTVSLWVAWELIEAGLARLADDGIGGEEWTQIHYRERFQQALPPPREVLPPRLPDPHPKHEGGLWGPQPHGAPEQAEGALQGHP